MNSIEKRFHIFVYCTSYVQIFQRTTVCVLYYFNNRMVEAFTELREQVNAGLLSYPYSTRELVNVAKHMQQYPHERYTHIAISASYCVSYCVS